MRPHPRSRLASFLLGLAGATLACASLAATVQQRSTPTPVAPVASAADAGKQVIAAGTVPDEATRAAILTRLGELYGPQRVVDRIEVDAVIAPPNWRDRVLGMLGPQLQQVSAGQLAIDGTRIRVSGQVGNEAARQQVASAIANAAGPDYVLKNALSDGGDDNGANPQALLDGALADRIVEFDSGSATLTAGGRDILDEMAAALAQLGNQQVQVIGHTDSVGPRQANIALSLQRAIVVKAYLEHHGISADNLGVQGFGPDRPIAENATDEGRSRNRRIEFRVL
ncbi:OmpA family protein [Lysobacter sp. A421]